MNYNRCNGCKRFYIGGSMVKGVVTRIVWVCLIL